jgi:hypothetical protein
LESRQLLAGYTPSAVEQLFLEQLNDARANPAAYGASIGLDLSNVAPSPPLAFNTQLIQAARLHSQDMSSRGYFDHTAPDGSDPGRRISDTGFVWNSWGESLAGGQAFPGPAEALRALIIDFGVADLGHRRHLLAMDSLFRGQTQVGIGILQSTPGPLANYYSIDSASTFSSHPFLTGVVFRDTNGNGKYAIGEGLGGVTITVSGVGTTTTFDSGGYSIPISPGTYTVTASGGGLPTAVTQTVTIGSTNVRVNLVSSNTANSDYIRKLYQTILGRQASDAEASFWTPALQSPAGVVAVVSAIERSSEARTRLVKNWYVTYLGREAGNGEEQGWVNALVHGAREEDVIAAILSSDEFFNRVASLAGAGTGAQRFLEALYSQLLNRTATDSEVNAWANAMSVVSRAQVVMAFLTSIEYRGNLVTGYYTGLLHRSSSPDPAEVTSWVASGLDSTRIRVGFEASNEFALNG